MVLLFPEHGAKEHQDGEDFKAAKNHCETKQEFRAAGDVPIVHRDIAQARSQVVDRSADSRKCSQEVHPSGHH